MPHREPLTPGAARDGADGVSPGVLGTWTLFLDNGAGFRCDRAARDLLGLDAAGQLAIGDLATNVHDADRPELEAALADLAIGAPAGPLEMRCRVVDPEGATRWIEVTGAAFGSAPGAEERPTLIAGTVRDITSRVESEQGLRAQRDDLQDRSDKLSLALSAADMGVWEYDLPAGIVLPDRRVSAFFGISHADAVPVERILEAIHPDDRRRIEVAVARAIEGAEGAYRESFRVRLPDGSVRWLDGLGRVTRRDAEGRPLRLSGVNLDVTLSRLQAERNRLLSDELRHRVRNLFGVVIALVRMSARGAPELGSAFGALIDRIGALSRAYEFTQGRLGATTLGDVVGDVLAPYVDGGGFEIAVGGDEIAIDEGMATTFALLVHELVTNALKHGALSGPGGRLSVRWQSDGETVSFEWRETGATVPAPPLVPPAGSAAEGTGFGSRLIAMAEAQLAGCVRREWTPEGLDFRLSFPAARVESTATAAE